ncbi:hypothetical protein J7T55_012542 [Diaporthe amygdali]|uniref:uncharacterized protein n=1 Tax=Phomopsis amygdali TaxID=1214568 RepID=UPI0022FE7884|nr:uncharacterized protein J7T55_012542 [Diaporthe amygdali]KAJ0115266.1 hypothetical protein J7T55_012542 [Diaporthe amygdali]
MASFATEDESVADLFIQPDFWKSSMLLDSPTPIAKDFFDLSDTRKIEPVVNGALGVPNDGYFKLPPDLNTGFSPEQQSAEPPANNDNEALSSPAPESEVDPWLFQQATPKTANLKTWDSFDVPEAGLKSRGFITEAGTGAYDLFLASKENPCGVPSHDSYETLEPHSYSACLLAMSLGRDSVLFSWDTVKKAFQPSLSLTKVPGYSGESLIAMLPLCNSCGQAYRRLRSFIDRTYSSSASPPRVALANALDSLLLVIQDELGRRGLRTISILQLQSLVRPVYRLLSYFHRLVMKIKRSTSDADLVSLIYNEAQSAEMSEPVLRDTMGQILRIVSTPWTEFVGEWIGLKPEEGMRISKNGPGKGFVKVENSVWIDDQGFELEEPDYFLDLDNMPSFVPDDVAQAIFETGRNLRFLQENHPKHPMASTDIVGSANIPRLEWQYDWESITRVEQKALEYQRAVLEMLQQRRDDREDIDQHSCNDAMVEDNRLLQVFGKDEQDLQRTVLDSIANLDRPIEKKETWNQLSRILREHLFDSQMKQESADAEFSPHWSLLPLLSFGPPVYAQARLINRECLRLLFSEHSLREHLGLQRAFQLLGNGMFSSRLANALFNPDMDTTERRSGVSRSGITMGLRLSSRDNWPPASSELRLALMGVLTESYQQESGADRRKPPSSTEHHDGLPGDLSFAIRDLSTEEMERCMDQGSLEALDFLRMSYKPPQALVPVITPASLLKYDRIFKLMLRVLRMLFVVDQLFRDTILRQSHWANLDDACIRFRVEAHHFVTNVARYFFDTGIDRPWHRFQTWLGKIEKGLQDSGLVQSSTIVSPRRLGEEHERTLDDIAQALLLRKRQQPVLKLLEEIFTQILRFAKHSRLRTPSDHDSEEIRKLYKAFREKIEVFITVCRGLGEKAGSKNDKDNGGRSENPLAILVLLLDMSNYYTKR